MRAPLIEDCSCSTKWIYLIIVICVCMSRERRRMAKGRLGGRWSGGRRSFASCFLTQGSLFALLYSQSCCLEWTYGKLAENLYPHNVHRCSIEPEDIPFQGFEGGAIVAFLLQVRNHIFTAFAVRMWGEPRQTWWGERSGKRCGSRKSSQVFPFNF